MSKIIEFDGMSDELYELSPDKKNASINFVRLAENEHESDLVCSIISFNENGIHTDIDDMIGKQYRVTIEEVID